MNLAAGLLRLGLLLLCLNLGTSAWAELAVPPLAAHVTDQTATLSPTELAQMEQQLGSFEASKGSQIAVLIVASTLPETIEQYSLRVVDQWKLGRKKVDDGALLLVAKDDHTVRIEVGYGLEGVLNDAVSKRIIDEQIVPRFKQGDFAGGMVAGTDQIMALVRGETLPDPMPTAGSELSDTAMAAIGVIVLISLITRAWLGALPGATATGGIALGVSWWLSGALPLALTAAGAAFVLTLIGGFNLLRLVLSASGGGGRSGGSSGGGGFGGGGGGSFGGGGASGRW